MSIEICDNCNDFYLHRSVPLALFNSFDDEMKSVDDDHFYCRDCGQRIERYSGYIEAFKRQSDESLMRAIRNTLSLEISKKAIDTVIFLIQNVRIPSFCYYDEDNQLDKTFLTELEKRNLIQVITTNGTACILINSYDLGLFDNLDILKSLNWHGYFYRPKPVDHRVVISQKKRKTRIDAMINDFTDEQKAKVLARFNGKCAFTGKDVPLHMDHVIPVATEKGGTTLANMLPIWQRINSSKSDNNVFEWYEKNGERFEVKPELFREAIEYIAELNDMTYEEYREYVYACHAKEVQTI